MAGLPFLYKGAGEHTGTALVMLPSGDYDSVFIADKNGQPIKQLKRNATHVPEPGEQPGEFGVKYETGTPGASLGSNFIIGVKKNGVTQYVNIANGGGEFRGHIDEGEGTLDKPADIAPYGPQGAGGGAGLGGAQTIGSYGVAPQYIGNQFPKPDVIPGALGNYQFIDPVKFAQQFAGSAGAQLNTNFAQSKEFSLGQLDTELQGLLNYVPKSAALQKQIVGEDNTFNQGQRTTQVNAAVPDVVKDLNQQAADARVYASGQVPDSVINRGLEVGVRGAAADAATTGGFGANSSAARKLSDLMSAQTRIGLSQYGEGLLSSNATQRTNLLLAPTEYANAGSNVPTSPAVSADQLQGQNFSAINAATVIPASTAYTNTINQSQFAANLDQRTQEFNSTNVNNFALSFFNYLNSYVNSVASAGQTNINTGLSLGQQQSALDLANKQMHSTQHSNAISSAIGAVGTVIGGALGAFHL